jgi:hypothetical protein
MGAGIDVGRGLAETSCWGGAAGVVVDVRVKLRLPQEQTRVVVLEDNSGGGAVKKNSSKFRPKFSKLTVLDREREKAHLVRIIWPVLKFSAQPGLLPCYRCNTVQPLSLC